MTTLWRIAFVTMAAASVAAPAAAQELRLVVQMPLAVAAAAEAGVPNEDLALLATALLADALSPDEFIETVHLAGAYELRERELLALPVDVREPWPDSDGPAQRSRGVAGGGMGPVVQELLDRGLRGRELSAAIHRELRRRGVPAGPKRLSPLEPGWLQPAPRGGDRGGPAAGGPDRGRGPVGAGRPGPAPASPGAGPPDDRPGRGGDAAGPPADHPGRGHGQGQGQGKQPGTGKGKGPGGGAPGGGR